MDKSFLELFIKEIKNFNYLTIVFTFFISTIYFIFDFCVIRHYMIHTIFTDILRSTFFIIWLFSIIFLFDKTCNYVIAYIRQKQIEKQQEEQYLNELEHIYKMAEKVIMKLTPKQKDILYQFIEENSCEVAFPNNESGYSSVPADANYINARLFGIGLNIILSSTFTHTILRINEFYYDILSKYFEKYKHTKSP